MAETVAVAVRGSGGLPDCAIRRMNLTSRDRRPILWKDSQGDRTQNSNDL
jgi:hypothetical protein